MFGLLFILTEWWVRAMMNAYTEFLGPQNFAGAGATLTVDEAIAVIARMMLALFGAVFPLLAVAMVAGIAINLIQVGTLFTTKPLMPKFDKLNPINGFKELISPKKLVELAKNLAKIIIVGLVAYNDYMAMLDSFAAYIGLDVEASFINILQDAFMMALRMCIAMVFISAADFFYQWWKYEKDLKMTKQEVKDEHKNTEGDPKIKSKIRQKQMQMSAMRMMSQVPEADVVITNPTHFAVALGYDDKKFGAPKVLAKGQDYIARKIRETAMEHDVHIVENPPLAQALFKACDVDEEIPSDLYQAVADILVFVYRQKGKLR
jgi:flagellar biosynthetic protein FlhB